MAKQREIVKMITSARVKLHTTRVALTKNPFPAWYVQRKAPIDWAPMAGVCNVENDPVFIY